MMLLRRAHNQTKLDSPFPQDMADTIQIVQWTLEMRCQLRDDEGSVKCPDKASGSVSTARAYSKARGETRNGFGNYDDVHVTSYFSANRAGDCKNGDGPHYPFSGFVISKEFRRFGGTEKLFDMCASCPANVQPQELARCVGTVLHRPDSPDTEEQLRRIISRLGLERVVADSFPKTTPLWYGLWAVSPVPKRSLGVLQTLLSEMLSEDRAEMEAKGEVDQDQIDGFYDVVSAIEIAISRGLNLHVNLLPLGHTDFGRYTIFPHCPFCKAVAPVKRWQRKYPTEHHTCQICGTKFSPEETASSERMMWKRNELRDELGQERFEAFAAYYLMEHGETPADAAAIVQRTEAKEERSKEMTREKARVERLREVYLHEHIYVGLDYLPAPRSDLGEGEEDCHARTSCTGWFTAENFSTVLQRCAEKGLKITVMQHRSSNPDFDRHTMGHVRSPLSILAKWQAEGCKEAFHAICWVPDSHVK